MGKRLNPVEVLIFTAVAGSFGVSAYRLLNERDGFEPSILAPMSSNPISESRAPASAPLFGQVDFDCQAHKEVTVAASKIRINGPICGSAAKTGMQGLMKASIVNTANQFTATVFTDAGSGKFSTDYIPLASEKNKIQVEFSFKGGKTYTHELTVQKQ